MIRGKNIENNIFVAGNKTLFDMSAAANGELVLIHPKPIRINNVYITWVESSSADAGSHVHIGKTDGGVEYAEITTTISQTAPTTNSYGTGSLTLATVPANTPIYINRAQKTGAGTCFVYFTYTIL